MFKAYGAYSIANRCVLYQLAFPYTFPLQATMKVIDPISIFTELKSISHSSNIQCHAIYGIELFSSFMMNSYQDILKILGNATYSMLQVYLCTASLAQALHISGAIDPVTLQSNVACKLWPPLIETVNDITGWTVVVMASQLPIRSKYHSPASNKNTSLRLFYVSLLFPRAYLTVSYTYSSV